MRLSVNGLSPLQQAHLACCDALDGLKKMFKPGVQLSIIMRTPGDTEAEFVVSNDDMQELIEVLERSKSR